MKSALTKVARITGRRVRGVSTGLVLAIVLVAAAPGAQATTFTTLANFQGGVTDGALPYGGLVMDSKGNLYGTTFQGGDDSVGTVFKVDTKNNETVIYPFEGTTDGFWPFGSLILDASGNLYGTASGGGKSGGIGTVFKLSHNKKGWKPSVLYTFTGGSDGAAPYAGLVMDSAGNLYGTTNGAAPSYTGSVFKWDHTTHKATKLHDFSGGTDGISPYAGLIMDTMGNLYGTTAQGGDPTCGSGGVGCGTVFEVDSTGKYSVLHRFSGGSSDGAGPYYGFLVWDGKGNLYGTTAYGGKNHAGVVFKLEISTGTLTVLHDFAFDSDGAFPLGSVVMDTAGNLYGTTSAYGGNGYGTVYRLDPSTLTFTTLRSFNLSTDGGFPHDNLILDKAGNLYGTCTWGGSSGTGCGGNGCGTVFKVTP